MPAPAPISRRRRCLSCNATVTETDSYCWVCGANVMPALPPPSYSASSGSMALVPVNSQSLMPVRGRTPGAVALVPVSRARRIVPAQEPTSRRARATDFVERATLLLSVGVIVALAALVFIKNRPELASALGSLPSITAPAPSILAAP